MNASAGRDAALPPGLAGRINPVCDRFEEQWQKGGSPRLEEFPEGHSPQRHQKIGALLKNRLR